MKKHIIEKIALTFVCVSTLMIIVVACFVNGKYYQTNATIVEKNIIMTIDGNLWEVDTNNKQIGEQIEVGFDNNFTPDNITDDKIIYIN